VHWQDLPKGTSGVICIVDSSDEERIELTRVALSGFYERHENLLKESALLVLANKQDRIDALSVMEVMRKMELETRFEGRRWHIQGTDTISGDGIEEGLEWIAMQISMIR
jgi:signal recognition particle receptor subunit beta